MVLFSAMHNLHQKNSNNNNNKNKNNKGNDVNPIVPIFGISMAVLVKVLDLAMGLLALYFYFKCNWAKGINKKISEKILHFLAACCCAPCYIAYHIAVPC